MRWRGLAAACGAARRLLGEPPRWAVPPATTAFAPAPVSRNCASRTNPGVASAACGEPFSSRRKALLARGLAVNSSRFSTFCRLSTERPLSSPAKARYPPRRPPVHPQQAMCWRLVGTPKRSTMQRSEGAVMAGDDDHRGSGPTRAELPIPDYDHLPLSDLTHRVRTLDEDGVTTLVGYERQHGARLPVLQLFETRLEALRAGAEPSGGSPTAATPTAAPPPAGTSSVSPATTGPKINPPSQGVPTNPAQPRSTG